MDPVDILFLALLIMVGLQVLQLIYSRRIMSTQVTAAQALADLNAGIDALSGRITDLQTADAAIDVAIATLEAQIGSGAGVDPVAIEAALAKLKMASDSIKPVVDDLTARAASATPPPPPPPPPVIAVSISPTTATVAQGSTQQFTATVENDAANAGVTWAVGDVSQGSVDQTGLYTPSTTPGTGTVVATSVTDTTKQATATVTF